MLGKTLPSGVLASVLPLFCNLAHAEPISLSGSVNDIDWISAGVGGVGGGSGTISLTGVSGTVRRALLLWHGIDNSAVDTDYDNAEITFAGTPVTGSSLGDSSTNCWGDGSARAYSADVTDLVDGNGDYTLGGLSQNTNNANGASLVVVFDDGDPTNNRDLVVFLGNDSSDPEGFPGEDEGWNATLSGVSYGGGTVTAQLHIADGQAFPDDSLTLSADTQTTIVDDTTLFDGATVPDAGTSRANNGSLWDIHDFDLSGLFSTPGDKTINISGMLRPPSQDCHSLVALLLDLEPGSAPVVQFASVSASDPDAAEPDDGGSFTVVVDPAPLLPITVNYSLSGSASPDVDYQSLSGSVMVPLSGLATIPVDVFDDTDVEEPETVILTLEPGSGYGLADPVTATVTIADDDDEDPVVVAVPTLGYSGLMVLGGLLGLGSFFGLRRR